MRTKDKFALELALEQFLQLTSSLDVAVAGSLSIDGKLVHFDNNVTGTDSNFKNIRRLVEHQGDLASLIAELQFESDNAKSTDDSNCSKNSSFSTPTAFKVKH
ncbi:hypothetical protein [Vibrio marisflavi]|uniref:Uncharacterized protein n=1 Tax=Vibrio marisflavi CECT 7928 TaxID=634439 RepID=A0ABM9A0W0_9VIBR|nr:hypothetical protein [Vibrio marisflavi]CAH0537063.1 hypothetical protein VMF7928_00899 [Vibrio marisflavi CECT 7928]